MTADGSACPLSLFDEGAELAKVMGDAIRKAALKAIAKNVPGERPLEVSGGGISILGQRNTDFTGELALPGGAAFDLPSELNPSGGEAFDMVAVVSDADPFKYAEADQGNGTGKVGFSGSVSLSFSKPVTGPVVVRNLTTPILITIVHPPLAENASIECRYNTTTQQQPCTSSADEQQQFRTLSCAGTGTPCSSSSLLRAACSISLTPTTACVPATT
jgi:hypothetical protein